MDIFPDLRQVSCHQGFYFVIRHLHNEKPEGDGDDIFERDLIKETFTSLAVLFFLSLYLSSVFIFFV